MYQVTSDTEYKIGTSNLASLRFRDTKEISTVRLLCRFIYDTCIIMNYWNPYSHQLQKFIIWCMWKRMKSGHNEWTVNISILSQCHQLTPFCVSIIIYNNRSRNKQLVGRGDESKLLTQVLTYHTQPPIKNSKLPSPAIWINESTRSVVLYKKKPFFLL